MGSIHISDAFCRMFKEDSNRIAVSATLIIMNLLEQGERLNSYQMFKYGEDKFVIIDEIGYVNTVLYDEYTTDIYK